jgi:hypothetical protein
VARKQGTEINMAVEMEEGRIGRTENATVKSQADQLRAFSGEQLNISK